MPSCSVFKIILSKLGLFAGAVRPVKPSLSGMAGCPGFLVALLVGFSLGGAGTIMQGIFKNPMASPGMMGIDSGAALGAVLVIYTGPGSPIALCPAPCSYTVLRVDAGYGLCHRDLPGPDIHLNAAAGGDSAQFSLWRIDLLYYHPQHQRI